MDNFSDKTAFVTGAGSGIGLEIARALAERGTQVMLADRDADRLERAKAQLLGINPHIDTVVCDVADEASMRAAAAATIKRFGKVHILVNNAGVSLTGKPGETPLEDWRWIIDINLMGVANGVEIFMPLIRSHGEGGHIVNTASMAGHLAPASLGPYNATKFAVVGLSETMRQDLDGENINVSVLCPSWVKTDIHNTFQGRPSGKSHPLSNGQIAGVGQASAAVETGINAALVGDWTVDCIAANRFYIFTHPQSVEFVNLRHAMIAEDFAAVAADPRFAQLALD